MLHVVWCECVEENLIVLVVLHVQVTVSTLKDSDNYLLMYLNSEKDHRVIIL